MKKAIFLIIFFTLFLACSPDNKELKDQLQTVEQLLRQQKNEQASQLLDKIMPETFADDEENTALYWLLRIQANCRLDIKVTSLEPMRLIVNYYEKHKDYDRLAWAYYYRGFYAHYFDKKTEAIIFMKKAESVALRRNQKELLHHIYQVITCINQDAKEYDMAKLYGKKALQYTKYLTHNRVYDTATDLLNLSAAYSESNDEDSAFYYSQKMIPLLDSIPKEYVAYHYGSIGFDYIGRDDELAKKYLNKAISILPDPYSYQGLAKVYAKEGNYKMADEMWREALSTNITNLRLKANIVKAMAQAKSEQGDYKAAHELDQWAIALKDSLHQQQRDENIRGKQDSFEQQEENDELLKDQKGTRWHSAALIAAILVLLASYALWRRRSRREVEQLHGEVEQRDNELDQLRQTTVDQEQRISQLNRKIGGFEQRHTRILSDGQRLYEELAAGGTTVRWHKEDFSHFVQYYKLREAQFVSHLENDYDDLSPRQKTLLILYDMGMNDENVMRILILEKSSLRAAKTRIKEKELREEPETPQPL